MRETERPNFRCMCEKDARSACVGESFYKEHGGKRYCVLHYPGVNYPGKKDGVPFGEALKKVVDEKSARFDEALRKKREAGDFNFRAVWFPGVADFAGVEFCSEANFEEAIFTEGADFSRATFRARANFVNAIFAGDGVDEYSAHFYSATFDKNGDFYWAEFRGRATFDSATFSAWADFNEVKFSARVKFNSAKFSDYARFSEIKFLCGDKRGDKGWMDFRGTRIEELGGIAFHTTTLRPHWFVSVDARKFEFTNIDWNWGHISIKDEVKELKRKRVDSPYRLLSIACRMLAVNAEENHRYEEASNFRYWSMDARRVEKWRGRAFLSRDWWLNGWYWLYWLASGYGEHIWQAVAGLIVLWALFAVLYTAVGFAQPAAVLPYDQDQIGQPLDMSRAASYSLGVITLQKPDPRPVTVAAHAVVTIESIIGPAQAALFLLAIRRRFMR